MCLPQDFMCEMDCMADPDCRLRQRRGKENEPDDGEKRVNAVRDDGNAHSVSSLKNPPDIRRDKRDGHGSLPESIPRQARERMKQYSQSVTAAASHKVSDSSASPITVSGRKFLCAEILFDARRC